MKESALTMAAASEVVETSHQVKGDVCITISEASPDKNQEDDSERNKAVALSPPQFLTPQPIPRRRSFNILQRRGSAKERRSVLPSPELLRRRSVRETRRKEFPASKPDANGTISILAEQLIPKKINVLLTKPSAQSPVSEKSPPPPPPLPPPVLAIPAERRRAAFRQAADSTVVRVLVHRESEEYNIEEQGS